YLQRAALEIEPGRRARVAHPLPPGGHRTIGFCIHLSRAGLLHDVKATGRGGRGQRRERRTFDSSHGRFVLLLGTSAGESETQIRAIGVTHLRPFPALATNPTVTPDLIRGPAYSFRANRSGMPDQVLHDDKGNHGEVRTRARRVATFAPLPRP